MDIHVASQLEFKFIFLVDARKSKFPLIFSIIMHEKHEGTRRKFCGFATS